MLYLKKFIVIVICVLSVQFLSAQNNYVTHTLKQGESLSMLAKQYNTSVGDIMRMNGMHADTKLVYGSQIKIPSTKNQSAPVKKESNNVTVTHQPAAAMSSNEITHVVMKGETLYSISKKYNLTVEQIKAWNHLTDENVKLGTLLIISESGSNKLATVSAQKQTAETVAFPEEKKEPAIDNKPDVAAEIVNKNEQPQPVLQTENNASSFVAGDAVANYSGQGYFEPQFQNKKSKNMQNVSGISKTFKTATGWTDGKYYILADNIEPGTIVKVTADNGNTVYAKVLWNMGDLKENAGINFRISNAAAAALHENDESFNINVIF